MQKEVTQMPEKNADAGFQKRSRAKKRNPALPEAKHILLCPPESGARRLPYRIFGYLCRMLVIWAAAGGLAVFLSGAMMYELPNSFLMGTALVCVGLISLFCLGWKTAVIGGVCAVGIAVWQLTSNAALLSELRYAPLALYNGCMRRLESAGYLTFSSMSVSYSSDATEEQLLKIGMAGVILIFSAVYTLCLLRRAKLLPPAIMSTAVLTVLLTFNIYSNRIQSNLGIVLVIVSFAAVLVMAACDRAYRPSRGKHGTAHGSMHDTAYAAAEELIPPEKDAQRPVMPESSAKERQSARSDRPAKQIKTVDEELTDYFSAGRSRRHARGNAPTAGRQDSRTQIRAVKKYDRITDLSRGAASGFIAFAALVVALLAVALPAVLIHGNFQTIDPLDEKLSFARDYVTAVLRGDDSKLDELSYQADSSHFTPRSTELEQLSFTGRQILYVKARYNTNYYLTGWIGTDYENGAWQAADTETRTAYRQLFGTDTSPSETIRYNFYRYTMSSLVDDVSSAEDLLDSYGGNRAYGFLTVLINMRRVNSPGSEALLPNVYASSFGLTEYNSAVASKLGIVNYFDGIRTGRDFEENGVSYASVAYAPVMSSTYWASNTADLSELWALGREAVLIRAHLPNNSDTVTASDSLLNLTTAEESGNIVFNYTYNVKKGNAESSFRFYHPLSDVKKTGNVYVITESTGTLSVTVSAGKVLQVSLETDDTVTGQPNLLEQYDTGMTDEQRTELLDALEQEISYSDFVYSTYTSSCGNEYIASLAAEIRSSAHRWLSGDTADGEQTLYASYLDVSMADCRNLSSAQAFLQRDNLVRCVIDYIIRDLGCIYTISPDLANTDSTLDGVENFLRNTKEGYCVQFASAAALLLREYGIPVRYVEGYIASNLEKISGDDFVYGGYVHDYEAHAWIEVYFDGIGWIQYETTPQYYTGLYGYGSAVTDTADPVILPDTETDSEDENQTEPGAADETDSETDSESDDVSETDTDSGSEGDPASRRAAGITLLILCGIGIAVALFVTVIRRARAAQNRRFELAERVLSLNHDPEEPRELARPLCDNVTELLALYGLSPETGEFPDAYADRLTMVLTQKPGRPESAEHPTLPPMHAVLDALAAEEFGNGMTTAEMKRMAELYLFLHAERSRFLRPGTRLWLHFVRHRL